MATSLNEVKLIGNVGKQPEVRTINDSTKVASFSLATSESFKDRNGERRTNTEWHSIVAYGGTADIIEKYINKGDMVYVSGKISYRTYNSKEGKEVSVTEIRISDIKNLSPRQRDAESAPSQSQQRSYREPAPVDIKTPFDNGDDLPW